MLNKIKCFLFGHDVEEVIDRDVLVACGRDVSGQLGVQSSISDRSSSDRVLSVTHFNTETITTICKRCKKVFSWNVIDY